MVWNESDTEDVNAKILEIEEYEQSCEIILKNIRKIIKGLSSINEEIPKDIDGSNMTDDRRSMLKTNLIANADAILPTNS